MIGVIVVMRPEGRICRWPASARLHRRVRRGLVNITIRQISRTEGTQTIVLWFTLLSMLVLGALMPFLAQAHDAGPG